ncbi:hypothetical protein CC79DRAFT_675943 [Sarocladium strictum]
MATLTSTTASRPTQECGSLGSLYDTPVRDLVCAMPYTDTNIALMASCCKKADVISYYDDCGLYCLAESQKVKDLSNCLYKAGADWEDVFCRGDEQASATGNGQPLPSSGTRVIDEEEVDDAEKKDDDDEKDTKDREDEEKDGSIEESAAERGSRAPKIRLLGVTFGLLFAFQSMNL